MSNYDVEKTIVVPDSGNGGCGSNFLAGMLASACQQRGLDANAVMALCGNRNGSFGNGWDGIIALIVIAAIFGGNGNGLFGGNNNNSTERQMLMDAIQRNGVDISQLASTLNCSIGQVQAAIQQVASQVCNVGNQVGMTGQQIINSIQQGNMALTQQICNCCCDIKTGIKDQTIALQGELNSVNRSVERGFADVGYATRDQTCNIVENMPTIIKIKERQADKLYECAEKVHRGAKKLMEFIEDEILESEEFDERYGGGNGGGTGGYRDEDDDDDEDYNERRGVPGTGRYGRRRYGRGRRY